MKETTKMSRTMGYLEKIYRLLNERYFENEMIMPIITVQSRPGTYGHISVGSRWIRKGDGTYELNICADYLDRNIENIVATMCHEMCHQWNQDHGIKDTSRGYTYHNKKFKERAEKSGLIINHDKTIGWSITEPSDDMLNFCIENDLTEIMMTRNLTADFSGGSSGGSSGYPTGSAPKKVKKPSSTRKYVCPCCGQSVRATKTVNIICGDCDKKMEEVRV